MFIEITHNDSLVDKNPNDRFNTNVIINTDHISRIVV